MSDDSLLYMLNTTSLIQKIDPIQMASYRRRSIVVWIHNRITDNERSMLILLRTEKHTLIKEN